MALAEPKKQESEYLLCHRILCVFCLVTYLHVSEIILCVVLVSHRYLHTCEASTEVLFLHATVTKA